MRFALACSSALALTLWLSSPALALTAQEVEEEVLSLLNETAVSLAPSKLLHEKLEVVPAGEGFRVTVPALRVTGTSEIPDLEIGTVSFHVAEPAEGEYRLSNIVVPKRMRFLDGQGQEQGSIAMDVQTFEGLYSAALGELTELDFLLNGLDMRIPDESTVIWVGRAAFALTTQPESERYHRQQQDYRLLDILVSTPEAAVGIESLELLSDMQGLDLDAYGTLMAILADLNTALEQGDQAKHTALREAMGQLAGQDPVATLVAQTMTLRGFSVSDGGGRPLLDLQSLTFGFDGAAERGQPTGSLGMRVTGEGLALNPANVPEVAAYADLIPHRFSFPVELHKLPLKALSESLVDLAFAADADPFGTRGHMDSAGLKILDILGIAGSELVIKDLEIESKLARMTGEAALTFSPSSPLGVVGGMAADFFGVDKVLAFANSVTDPDVRQGLSAAALGIMGMGQATAQPDGSVGYRFQFLMAPDGGVTMNGMGMGDLLNTPVPQ